MKHFKDYERIIAVKEKRPEGPSEEVRRENDYGYAYERFFSYFTAEEMVEYFQSAGMVLEYVSIKGSGRTNWIQTIARKTA